jgi:hypothetical protein
MLTALILICSRRSPRWELHPRQCDNGFARRVRKSGRVPHARAGLSESIGEELDQNDQVKVIRKQDLQ